VGKEEASKRVMEATPDLPAIRFDQKSAVRKPTGLITPMPTMPTLLLFPVIAILSRVESSLSASRIRHPQWSAYPHGAGPSLLFKER
jgi:hypothetical protein